MCETTAPQGYNITIDCISVSIYEDNQVIDLGSITNDVNVNQLEINKYGKSLNNFDDSLIPLAQVEFELTHILPDGSSEVINITTGDSGEVIYNNLKPGDYVLKEVSEIDGYNTTFETEFSIDYNSDNVVYTVTNEGVVEKSLDTNAKLVNDLELYNLSGDKLANKFDNFDSNNYPGSGFEFELYQSYDLIDYNFDGQIDINDFNIGYANGSLTPVSSTTSNEDGSFVFKNLKYGTYYLVEVPTVGYVNIKPIETNLHEDLVLEPIENKVIRGDIIINKYTIINDEEVYLSGSCFNINGFEVCDNDDNDKDKNDGVIRLSEVVYGDYIITESVSPEGYELDDTAYNVSIVEDSSEVYVKHYNAKITNDIIGSKRVVIGDTTSSMSGVEFGLFEDLSDYPNNPITTTKTDENGQYRFSDVEYGSYYVLEINNYDDDLITPIDMLNEYGF